jgi:hypothetical protein
MALKSIWAGRINPIETTNPRRSVTRKPTHETVGK